MRSDHPIRRLLPLSDRFGSLTSALEVPLKKAIVVKFRTRSRLRSGPIPLDCLGPPTYPGSPGVWRHAADGRSPVWNVPAIGGMTGEYSIQRLSAHTWNAFAGLVERHNGIFGGCWCTYFHDCAERQPGYEGSRALKKRLVEAGQAHAALVMIGDEAIAWAEYGTPD